MAGRKSFSIGKRPNVTSISGVLGVTKTFTLRGAERWNAWAVDGTGRTMRIYYGPSFDDAVIARQQWEEAVKNELP